MRSWQPTPILKRRRRIPAAHRRQPVAVVSVARDGPPERRPARRKTWTATGSDTINRTSETGSRMRIVDDRLIHQMAGVIRTGALAESQLAMLDDAIHEWDEICHRVRRGTVARWRADETYGFIDEDGGTAWFVSRGEGAKHPAGLAENDKVTFSGSPIPEPRRRYPTAGNISRLGDEPGVDTQQGPR